MRFRRSVLALLCTVGFCAAYTSSAAAQSPTIESQFVTSITSSNATLNARINPNGLLTKYRLQIDTTGSFRFFQVNSCDLHLPNFECQEMIEPGDPLPPGLVEPSEMTLSAQSSGQAVSIDLGSIGAVLQPETTYHFRAIAANSDGFTYGPDQTFTTPPKRPAIEDQSVTDISSTSATLNARINPNGLLTKYRLQIDTTGSFEFSQDDSCPLHPPGILCLQEEIYGESLPIGLVEPPEMTLPSTTDNQLVSVTLADIGAVLQPETIYHFRAIAGNSKGIVYGPNLTFTTLALPPLPTEEKPTPGEEEQDFPEEELPPGEEAPTSGPQEQEGQRGPTIFVGLDIPSPIAVLLDPITTSKPALRKKKHRKGHHQRRNRKVVRRSPIR